MVLKFSLYSIIFEDYSRIILVILIYYNYNVKMKIIIYLPGIKEVKIYKTKNIKTKQLFNVCNGFNWFICYFFLWYG